MAEGLGSAGRRTIMTTIRDRHDWYRSSYCTGAAATCVEVAMDEMNVLVRDSKNPNGPVLRFSHEEWQAFLHGVLDGEFN
ncbi:MAG TPA: DUF397 domain-containing protein [Pseudonocardiaceae bacterium]